MGIYDVWQQPAVLAMMVVGWLGWLGYFLWLRKFFRPAEPLSAPIV